MKFNSKRHILFALIALIAISIPAAYAAVQTSIDDYCDPAPTTTLKDKYWICHDLHPRVTALESITIVNGTDGVDGVQGPQGIQGIAGQAITGEIKLYSGTTTPTGFLLADGAAVSRTTYSDLFTVIGTTFGTGDDSTTFNLPNLVQKFPRGATSPGNTGGADTVALTIAEMPSHNHGVSDPGHVHDIQTIYWSIGGSARNGFIKDYALNDGFFASENGVTGITINSTGSGNTHENKPSYLEILYIIKY